MPISRVNTDGASATTTTTFNVPAPAGVAVGDLLLVSISFSRSSVAWTVTSYPNWTIQEDLAETSMITRVIWRIADGTASDTIPTFGQSTTGPAVGTSAAYRGVDPTNPFIDELGRIHTEASATAHPGAAITNTDAGAWGIYCGHARQVATPLTWTVGSGLTELQDRDAGNSTTNNCAAVWADSNGPVATGVVTYTASTSAATAQANMWTAFLRPAAGGGGTPATAAGSITIGGADTAQARAATTSAGIVLAGGTATGQARATVAGAVALGGTPAARGATTAAGSISLGGSATAGAAPVAATATGSVTLGGTSTARGAAVATGGISLGGTSVGRAPVASLGSVALGGAPVARAATSSAGDISLGGTATARGAAAAAGSIALGGAATGAAVTPGSSASGSVALGGVPTARATTTSTGVIVLSGAPSGRAAAASGGSIALSGSQAARGASVAAGAIVLGGAVTARVPATVSGAVFLNGLALGEAMVVWPSRYVFAVLSGDGTSAALLAGGGPDTAILPDRSVTAILTTSGVVYADLSDEVIGGFGLHFGLSFGGPTVPNPTIAALTEDGSNLAVLVDASVTAQIRFD